MSPSQLCAWDCRPLGLKSAIFGVMQTNLNNVTGRVKHITKNPEILLILCQSLCLTDPKLRN